jgi:putative Ca2+/H+ antiporter (TMEM165/GDT1 family)
VNWQLLLTTFGSVFLAELGDKTQLATLSFACANRGSFWTIFTGSALALVASSLVATCLGSVMAKYLPVRWVHLGAGILFIVLGALLVVRTVRSA